MITLSISGYEEVTKELLSIKRKFRGTIIKRCLNASVKPIIKAAERRAPKGTKGPHDRLQSGKTEALQAAISYHTAEKRGSRGTVFHSVVGVKTKSPRPRPRAISRGPNKGKVQLNLPTRTAHMIEYGFTHKRGDSVQWIPPRPFMRPAWTEQGGERAFQVFFREMESQITAI